MEKTHKKSKFAPSSRPSKLPHKKQIKQMVQQEIENKISNTQKYVDFVGNTSGVVGGVQAFTLPVSGVNVDERIGLGITLSRIDMRIFYDITELTTVGNTYATSVFVRLTIVQVIGEEVITASDVYDNTASAAGVIVSPFSYANKDKLFKVLYDKVIRLDTFNRTSMTIETLKPKIKRLRWDAPNNVWSTGEPYIITSYFSDGGTPAIRQCWDFRTHYVNM